MEGIRNRSVSKSSAYAPKKKFLIEYQADEQFQKESNETSNDSNQKINESKTSFIGYSNLSNNKKVNNDKEVTKKTSSKLDQNLIEKENEETNLKQMNISSCISQIIVSELNQKDENCKISFQNQPILPMLSTPNDQNTNLSDDITNERSHNNNSRVIKNVKKDNHSIKNDLFYTNNQFINISNKEDNLKSKGFNKIGSEAGFSETVSSEVKIKIEKQETEIMSNSKSYVKSIDNNRSIYRKPDNIYNRNDSKYINYNTYEGKFEHPSSREDTRFIQSSNSPIPFVPDLYNTSQMDKKYFYPQGPSHIPHFPSYPLPSPTHHPLHVHKRFITNNMDIRHSPYSHHSNKHNPNKQSERLKVAVSPKYFSKISAHSPDPQQHLKGFAHDSRVIIKLPSKYSTHSFNNSSQKAESAFKSLRAESESPIDLSVKKDEQAYFEHRDIKHSNMLFQHPNFTFKPIQSFADHHALMLASLHGIPKPPLLHENYLKHLMADDSQQASMLAHLSMEEALKHKMMKGFMRESMEAPGKSHDEHELRKNLEINKYKDTYKHNNDRLKAVRKSNENPYDNHLDYYPRLEELNRSMQASIPASNYSPFRSSPPKFYPILPSASFNDPNTDTHSHSYHCTVCDSIHLGYRKFRAHFLKNHGMEPHSEHFFIINKLDKIKHKSTFAKNESPGNDFKVSGIMNEGMKRVAEVFPMVSSLSGSNFQQANITNIRNRSFEDKLRIPSFSQESRFGERLGVKRRGESESNCMKCIEGFQDVTSWKEHVSSMHSSQLNSCKCCKMCFLSADELHKHVQSKHGMEGRSVDVVFKCLYCRMVFTDEEVLLVHTKEHEKAVYFTNRLSFNPSNTFAPSLHPPSSHPSIQTELPDTTTCLEPDLKQPLSNKIHSPKHKSTSPINKLEYVPIETEDKNKQNNSITINDTNMTLKKSNDNIEIDDKTKKQQIEMDSKRSFKKRFFMKKFQLEEESALVSQASEDLCKESGTIKSSEGVKAIGRIQLYVKSIN